jgi:diguanylate cyclase (GGDEF)-like protein/PAS domain S-box-containing protein
MDKNFYAALIETLSDGVYFVDRRRRITGWNQAAERISGFSREEVMGQCCAENILCHVDEAGTELCTCGCPLAATLKDGTLREDDIFLHQKSGARLPVSVRVSPVRDEDGQIIGAVEVFSDSSQRAALHAEIEALKQATLTDPLTCIGNRRYAELKLEGCLRDARTMGLVCGVLLLDIDHFKRFNDEHGHHTGDAVLNVTARTMTNVLGSLDVVARWGGEEFIVLLPNADPAALVRKAEMLRVMVEKSWLTAPDGARLTVTISIGGTLTESDDTLDTVVSRADALMYESKHAGRNRVTLG